MHSARTEIALLVSLLDEDEIDLQYNDLIIALPTSKK